MRRYAFVTVDVFTEHRFGGNQLAVLPAAQGLTDVEMQCIAAEFNLSETAFVLPPVDPKHTARVRIFHRKGELPFAGHPNVGTGVVLAQQGRDCDGVLLFEEHAGLVKVRVHRGADGIATAATIVAPQPLSTGPDLDCASVAACANLSAADLITQAHAPLWASMGNPYVIAEVTDDALTRARPDVRAFERLLAANPWMRGRLALHMYTRDETQIRARMFSPLAGTVEDAATGSANAPLGALLLSLGNDPAASFRVVQGVEMGRPSLLHVSAERTPAGIVATVGGNCVAVMAGDILV